jgi:hypothetical protein
VSTDSRSQSNHTSRQLHHTNAHTDAYGHLPGVANGLVMVLSAEEATSLVLPRRDSFRITALAIRISGDGARMSTCWSPLSPEAGRAGPSKGAATRRLPRTLLCPGVDPPLRMLLLLTARTNDASSGVVDECRDSECPVSRSSKRLRRRKPRGEPLSENSSWCQRAVTVREQSHT